MLDFFRNQGVAYPELCFLVSSAVGFPVSIYWIGLGGPNAKSTQYQVMRWDEDPGPGQEFWDWYLYNRPQFFASPELAAVTFVQEWHCWSSQHVVCDGVQEQE
jgi:hypothetical protein